MPIFTREGETLHLAAWEYHAALTMEALKQLAVRNGARLCSADRYKDDIFAASKHGFIVNRTQNEIIHELESTAKRCDDAGVEVPPDILEKIARYKNFPNEPVPVGCSVYLSVSFVMGGVYYSFSMDANPFFDCYYTKAEVFDLGGRNVCADSYAEVVPDSWYSSLPLCSLVDDEIIRQTADNIFTNLEAAEFSKHVKPDTKRIRVPNIHNDGYHYETVSTPVSPLYIHDRED